MGYVNASRRFVRFQRIPAVDGSLLHYDDVMAIYQPIPNAATLTLGEVGCFLSHRNCWSEIALGQEPFGCVFEDDVIISSHLLQFIGDDTNWIPADADIVKIETVLGRVWLDRVVSYATRQFPPYPPAQPALRDGWIHHLEICCKAAVKTHRAIFRSGRPCDV
ncbi:MULTISPECIES: glycosyltransferase family 25 protein [unclassified Mesorhizobium]|uniref:glycosyltransferase family 25 protein n=1 Tax=Mesorhizobium sp. ESP-6-2 TaxID=2876625 RepID=UPI00112EA442|nr:glycosyltransferase family 25 protein [Mesorhizobium sp. ESP-6-2]TPM27863.1 glycosyltransferase family 25 protein [Mesorhizobium sp. B2-2-2]